MFHLWTSADRLLIIAIVFLLMQPHKAISVLNFIEKTLFTGGNGKAPIQSPEKDKDEMDRSSREAREAIAEQQIDNWRLIISLVSIPKSDDEAETVGGRNLWTVWLTSQSIILNNFQFKSMKKKITIFNRFVLLKNVNAWIASFIHFPLLWFF